MGGSRGKGRKGEIGGREWQRGRVGRDMGWRRRSGARAMSVIEGKSESRLRGRGRGVSGRDRRKEGIRRLGVAVMVGVWKWQWEEEEAGAQEVRGGRHVVAAAA